MADFKGFGVPSSANEDNLLHARFAQFIELDEEGLEATGEVGAALFQLYAMLRAKRFTAAEAERVLNTLSQITLHKYAQGFIPTGEHGTWIFGQPDEEQG